MLDSQTEHAALAYGAALGLPGLAGVLAGAEDGVAVVDDRRRFVYANPAACEMLGATLGQLRGSDFVDVVSARERASMLARISGQFDDPTGPAPDPFTCTLCGPGGTEREIGCFTFVVEADGSRHGVVIFQYFRGSRATGRAAAALAQTASQLVRTGLTTDEILAGTARHAVEETRALACRISVVDENDRLASAGGYGPGYGLRPDGEDTRSALWVALADQRPEDVIAAITGGSIMIGEVPGKPVVLLDAPSVWADDPIIGDFAASMTGLDWHVGVFLPLSWENRVFGLFAVYLPDGIPGPSEVELAFYTALANQAAVAVVNARLNRQVRQSATASERARLARELHDSVSQGLFSMTMHARAAQLALTQTGLDADGALGRSIAELSVLTRGALAEMRALIFELRPAALAEEGLVAALRKQAAALTARAQLTITVDAPKARLDLASAVEEHLYRIASEALHNVINHADAASVRVRVSDEAGQLLVEVRDDGRGFDPRSRRPGHLGLLTMAERSEAIGAELSLASAPGQGTTVSVSVPEHRRGRSASGSASSSEAGKAGTDGPAPATAPDADPPAGPRDRQEVAYGGTSDEHEHPASGQGGSSAVADAAALGLATLSAMLAGAPEGIGIVDADLRWVYANPAACELLGSSPEQLLGLDLLTSVPVRERDFVVGRFSDILAGAGGRFGSVLLDAAGDEHETVQSISTTEIGGSPHAVVMFRDVTGSRAAARAAVALTQAASQLVEAGTADEILAGIARHAVEGTRALVCGISAVGDDHMLAEAGSHSSSAVRAGGMTSAGLSAAGDVDHARVITALTGGSIVVGEAPGSPVVLADVRSVWNGDPVLEAFLATLDDDSLGAAVFVPLSWENRAFGLFVACLPAGVSGPIETELAFFTALADQAAVVVTIARLTSQARQGAALLERSRLARELHDSVSQALFSMTMHARAAQLAMVKAGLDEGGPLGRSITELAELTRGALAEMRALIFELRPAALAEEGLVAALRKQVAALNARAEVKITVQSPDDRLTLESGTEEHLYRIVSEALHNVVNHARAGSATVTVTERADNLHVLVNDDGMGFDQDHERPGHFGLLTMAERAETIGAQLTVSSTPGDGTTVSVSLLQDRKEDGKDGADVN